MAWVAVGIGTALLGALVVYWQDVKKLFSKRRVVIVVKQTEQQRALQLTEVQIIMGALAWAGCKRYLYLCEDKETGGVVWAQSEQGAQIGLERRGIVAQVIWRADWSSPAESDLFIFDEEV